MFEEATEREPTSTTGEGVGEDYGFPRSLSLPKTKEFISVNGDNGTNDLSHGNYQRLCKSFKRSTRRRSLATPLQQQDMSSFFPPLVSSSIEDKERDLESISNTNPTSTKSLETLSIRSPFISVASSNSFTESSPTLSSTPSSKTHPYSNHSHPHHHSHPNPYLYPPHPHTYGNQTQQDTSTGRSTSVLDYDQRKHRTQSRSPSPERHQTTPSIPPDSNIPPPRPHSPAPNLPPMTANVDSSNPLASSSSSVPQHSPGHSPPSVISQSPRSSLSSSFSPFHSPTSKLHGNDTRSPSPAFSSINRSPSSPTPYQSHSPPPVTSPPSGKGSPVIPPRSTALSEKAKNVNTKTWCRTAISGYHSPSPPSSPAKSPRKTRNILRSGPTLPTHCPVTTGNLPKTERKKKRISPVALPLFKDIESDDEIYQGCEGEPLLPEKIINRTQTVPAAPVTALKGDLTADPDETDTFEMVTYKSSIRPTSKTRSSEFKQDGLKYKPNSYTPVPLSRTRAVSSHEPSLVYSRHTPTDRVEDIQKHSTPNLNRHQVTTEMKGTASGTPMNLSDSEESYHTKKIPATSAPTTPGRSPLTVMVTPAEGVGRSTSGMFERDVRSMIRDKLVERVERMNIDEGTPVGGLGVHGLSSGVASAAGTMVEVSYNPITSTGVINTVPIGNPSLNGNYPSVSSYNTTIGSNGGGSGSGGGSGGGGGGSGSGSGSGGGGGGGGGAGGGGGGGGSGGIGATTTTADPSDKSGKRTSQQRRKYIKQKSNNTKGKKLHSDILDFSICFVGPPSCGKSTIIKSLYAEASFNSAESRVPTTSTTTTETAIITGPANSFSTTFNLNYRSLVMMDPKGNDCNSPRNSKPPKSPGRSKLSSNSPRTSFSQTTNPYTTNLKAKKVDCDELQEALSLIPDFTRYTVTEKVLPHISLIISVEEVNLGLIEITTEKFFSEDAQEIYDCCDIFLIIFDTSSTSSYKNIYSFLEQIRHIKQEAPTSIILVGNILDETVQLTHSSDVKRLSERIRHPFLEINSLNQRNIPELLTLIMRHIKINQYEQSRKTPFIKNPLLIKNFKLFLESSQKDSKGTIPVLSCTTFLNPKPSESIRSIFYYNHALICHYYSEIIIYDLDADTIRKRIRQVSHLAPYLSSGFLYYSDGTSVHGYSMLDNTDVFKFTPDKPGVISRYLIAERGVFIGTKNGLCYAWLENGAVFEFTGVSCCITCIHVYRNYVFAGTANSEIFSWEFINENLIDHTRQIQYKYIAKGHCRVLTGLYVNDNYLYSASSDETLRVWNIENGECLYSFSPKNSALQCGFLLGFNSAFDGQVFVTSPSSAEIQLIKLKGKLLKVKSKYIGHQGCITAFKFRSNFLIASADRIVRIWDIKSANCLLICTNKAKVTDIALSDYCLYVACEDGKIGKWQFIK